MKACLLYGQDNPIDGIVLDVLLRKVREIKRATGINVLFPEDSQTIIDTITITQALLLNPQKRVAAKGERRQLEFDFGEFEEAAERAIFAPPVRAVAGGYSRQARHRSLIASAPTPRRGGRPPDSGRRLVG